MNQNTKRLTESAIMIALASVLSMITIWQMPQGGAITPASMVPIILISLRYDVKWAMLCSLVYAGIQMILGFYAPPTPDFISFLLVILLDYVVAFGVLGLAGTFGRLFKKPMAQILFGAGIVIGLRFLCHFASGIIIWSSYAPAGQPVWLYSLVYNGTFILGELIVSLVVLAVLFPFLSKYLKKGPMMSAQAKMQ